MENNIILHKTFQLKRSVMHTCYIEMHVQLIIYLLYLNDHPFCILKHKQILQHLT